MRRLKSSQNGYTLVELLVAMAIGLVLIGGVITAYLVQTQVYKVTNSQAAIQNAENAIAVLVLPVIKSSGFLGCSTTDQPTTNTLNGGAPPPLGAATTPGMVFGYDASGTAGGGALTLATRNPANDASLADWSPSLDASLTSLVQIGGDVLTLFGPTPNSQPIAVTSIASGSNALTTNGTSTLSAGQLAAVSDCSKSTIFSATGVAGSNVTHAVSAGTTGNATAAFSVLYINPQLVPLQQTAFYVGQGLGGQSALMRANYTGGAWVPTPLVPGVQNMQALYGTGSGGVITQYVPASAVSNWLSVYSVRLAFLIEGQAGSGGPNNPTAFDLLGTTVSVTQDGRLRRVYGVTVDLRNQS